MRHTKLGSHPDQGRRLAVNAIGFAVTLVVFGGIALANPHFDGSALLAAGVSGAVVAMIGHIFV